MNKFNLEIKWGLIFTAIALLWMVLEKALGWHDENIEVHPKMTMLFIPISIVVFILALLNKKRSLDGKMNWKQGFLFGLIMSIVITILAPISQLITHLLVSPSYFPNAIHYAVENNYMSQEAAEAHYNLSNYIITSTIASLIFGVVVFALLALIFKSKKEA